MGLITVPEEGNGGQHALEKLLADVVGLETKPHQEDGPDGIREGWVYLKRRDSRHETWLWWEPFTDANQMRSVLQAVLAKGATVIMSYSGQEEWASIHIIRGAGRGLANYTASSTKPGHAFGLAVKKMKESTNGIINVP